jgi:hypothetical protein
MRSGTLNLDTRRNVVPSECSVALTILNSNCEYIVGSSVHRMFDARLWALLPDDDIVQQYSECLGAMVSTAYREKFPVIEVVIHVDSTAIAVAQGRY